MSLRTRASRNADPAPPAAQPGGWAPPAPAFEPELLGSYDLPTAYDARPQRPGLQRAARAGLWGAVVVGCLGGLVGLVGRPSSEPEPVVEQSGTDVGVPAPVAGIAERAVRAWLSATGPGDAPRLAELYVEPPVVRVEGGATLVPEDVTTVAGTRQMDGYWAVTVAARVVEVSDQAADAGADPAAAPAADPAANPGTGLEGSDEGVAGLTGEPVDATWYIQVGIVGDDAGGLKALTTPSILPGPPGTVADGWRSSASPIGSPTDGDPVASTVQGFLRALLADGGDPERYLATGLRIDAADPPTFESVEVTTISVDDLGDGQTRALAQIEGRTSSGLVVTSSYEVILAERTDRLEITGFSGAPTLVVAPPADDPANDPAATAADPDAPEGSTTEPTGGGEAP